jgi:hypothetical protein
MSLDLDTTFVKMMIYQIKTNKYPSETGLHRIFRDNKFKININNINYSKKKTLR